MEIKDLKKITDLLEQFIQPITKATSSPLTAKGLLLELGYVPPPQLNFIDQLSPSIKGIKDIVQKVKQLAEAGGEPDESDILSIVSDLIGVVPPLFKLLKDIDSSIQSEFSGQPILIQTDILTKFPERLLNLLLIKFFEDYHYPVFSILQLFKVIQVEEIETAENEYKFPYIKYEIDWSKFGGLFSDPKELLLSALRDGTGYFFNDIIYSLQEVGLSLGLFSNFRYPNVEVLQLVNNNPNITDWSGFKDLEILRIPFAPSVNPDIGVDIYPLIDTNTDTYTGLVLGIGLDTNLDFDIGDLFNLKFTLSANLANGLGFTVDKNDNFKFIADLFTSPSNIADNLIVGFKAALTTIAGSEEDDPLFRVGSPDGSRFELGSFGLTFGVEKNENVHLFFETDFKDGKIVIDFGSADGFVSNIAGSGIESNFNLGIGFSNQRGLYFKGGSGLEITLPVHIDFGLIKIEGLSIGLLFKDDKVPLTIAGTIGANLGPLQAVVEDIGIKAVFDIKSDRSGNLGPIDLDLGFKPPNGVGLSLDAGVIKGGGYLFFDTDREEYAGALELVFSEWIALKAIGLVTTRMPDGSKGFSLLVIITVEFGSGIQLGFGFTLIGVGGLLGLHRTVKIDPLAQGVRTGSVESVMFPQDIVANAPRIISDLKKFFPVYQDLFLIGPMAKIGYGTPTLASLSLGLIIEFPEVTITILGVLKVVLPDEKADVLRLQVNFVGRVEPANKLLWFYAELYDSRVLFITLEGGMGLLVNWGSNSNFVFSVGGFHPRYNPPPLPFPSPPRLAVNILNESYARVRIEGYFAVTSNSVQFGARVEVYFGVSAFNIDGHFGFDALFQFDPFYFSFSLSVSLSVKLFGMGLFSVGFSGLLEGPTPWHIKGKGSIGFLFFTISVPFEETWGEKRHTELPPIKVFPLIEKEIDALTNWEAVVPKNSSILVTLRQMGSSKDDELVLHPVGTLRISQRKLPLKLKLDKVGNQRPSDTNKLSLKASITGGGTLDLKDTKEKFATGEFKDLDNSKKLSSPGFELYVSGLEIKPEGEQLKTSMAAKRIIRYETVIIDNSFKRHIFRFFQVVNVTFVSVIAKLFNHFLSGNAVTKSTLSHYYRKQIQPNNMVITVNPNQYTVAFNDTNKPIDQNASQFDSHASAMDYLEEQIQNDPGTASRMHVIPNTEINAL